VKPLFSIKIIKGHQKLFALCAAKRRILLAQPLKGKRLTLNLEMFTKKNWKFLWLTFRCAKQNAPDTPTE